MALRRSSLLKRRVCRRIGHDWGNWLYGFKGEHRDCQRCWIREVRLDYRGWIDKRWLYRRTLILGRVVEWHD